MLVEVSFYSRTLPKRLPKEAKELQSHCIFLIIDVIERTPTVVERSNLSCIRSRGRGEAQVLFSTLSIFSTEPQLLDCGIKLFGQ